jgi:hypothetical protein
VAQKKRGVVTKKKLKSKILAALKDYGFKINPHLRPAGQSKYTLKRMQRKARLEQIALHAGFLKQHLDLVKSYCKNGKDIIPERIDLELREVEPESFEEVLFRWWNFIWWNMPYQHPYGRQMRFLLWDKYHDCPFGLISLQSPVLKMSVRDKALDIPAKKLDVWVNKSMHAQIRASYKKKYAAYTTLIKHRKLKPELLFITTTSAFGRSSIYNRLKYNDETVAECLGYTQGTGSFHIPEDLYVDLLTFLKRRGINVAREYGNGPSRKLKLLSIGLSQLGLPSFECHGIKREFYLFPLAKNLKNAIHHGKRPMCFNRSFESLVDYWKERWAIPRAERLPGWRDFQRDKFFKKTKKMLRALQMEKGK